MMPYYYNDNGDDDDDIGDDDFYKIFIADHGCRYSLLYSVIGFFATTLLEPYSKSKKATRWTLILTSFVYFRIDFEHHKLK